MKILLIMRAQTEEQDHYVKAREHLLQVFPDAVFTDQFDSSDTAFQICTIVATEKYFSGGIDPKVWIGITASDLAIDVEGTLSVPGDDRGLNQFRISKVRGWLENGMCRIGAKVNHSGLYGLIGYCYGIWKFRLTYLRENG